MSFRPRSRVYGKIKFESSGEDTVNGWYVGTRSILLTGEVKSQKSIW